MIRSLTLGLPLGQGSPASIGAGARAFVDMARAHLERSDLLPRTMRFTLPPFGIAGEMDGAILNALRWVDEVATASGVRWLCMPLNFVETGRRQERLLAALHAMGRFPRTFVNLIVADQGRISVDAINDAAGFILNVARKTNNGYDNFRVGVSANCPANAPFFPFSRHEGDAFAFSFALETTGIALAVMNEPDVRHGRDISLVRDRMVAALVPVLKKVNELGMELAEKGGVEYRGLDASLAPFPDGEMSVGALIERILGAPVGSHGSVFITSILTDALRVALSESGALAIGFNGVMFSVLEDDRLAAASSCRVVTIDSLTALASVCGCGIDMVPVPGVSFQEEIAAVIMDIAGLSCTLNKPLGVRLLPIPNKGVNEFTEFNLDFLCDSRVLALTPNDHRFTTMQSLLEFRAPLHRRTKDRDD